MKSPRSIGVVMALIVSAAALGVWNANHHPLPAPDAGPPEQSESSTPRYRPLARAGAAAEALAAEETAQGESAPESRMNMFTDPEQAPGWSVAYGKEFWNRKPLVNVPVKGSTPLPEGVNVGDIVERISHAFNTSETDPLPHVYAATYTARIDEDGLSFSPHRVEVDPNAPSGTATATPDPATQAKFRTVSVSRGADALYSSDESAPERAIIGNTAQALLHEQSGLVEHYEADGSGVEVTWVLPDAPAGSGPLTIDTELSGLTYAGETEAGHHYADANNVARVQVGRVTVFDAGGRNWNVPMTAQDERLTVTVPEEILATAEYPLAIDPKIGAEFGTDKRVNPSVTDQQYSPALAWNGAMFLLVWRDSRNTATSGYDIFGTRLTKKGKVKDAAGIAICTAANNQYDPAVAANAGDFLVVWEDYRTEATSESDIYGNMVKPNGTVTFAGGIAIAATANYEFTPSVAGNGTDFLVTYDRGSLSFDYDVLGTRVSSAGVLVGTHNIFISMDDEYDSAVASVLGDYLVVCYSSSGGSELIQSRLVRGNGTMGSVTTLCNQPDYRYSPQVAASSNNYLVVWTDERNYDTMNRDTYGALVSAGGTVPNTVGFPICATPVHDRNPMVVFDGRDYDVISRVRNSTATRYDLVLTRVNTAGIVLNAPGMHINGSTDRYSSTLASAKDGKFLLVSEALRGGHEKLIGTRLDAMAAQAAPVIQFTSASMSVRENAGSAIIKIKCKGANAGAVSVSYSTMNGTAVSPGHYQAASGTLVFEKGQTTKSITVPVFDNLTDNPDRTFVMLLSGPTGNAVIGLNSMITVTIKDND